MEIAIAGGRQCDDRPVKGYSSHTPDELKSGFTAPIHACLGSSTVDNKQSYLKRHKDFTSSICVTQFSPIPRFNSFREEGLGPEVK